MRIFIYSYIPRTPQFYPCKFLTLIRYVTLILYADPVRTTLTLRKAYKAKRSTTANKILPADHDHDATVTFPIRIVIDRHCRLRFKPAHSPIQPQGVYSNYLYKVWSFQLRIQSVEKTTSISAIL